MKHLKLYFMYVEFQFFFNFLMVEGALIIFFLEKGGGGGGMEGHLSEQGCLLGQIQHFRFFLSNSLSSYSVSAPEILYQLY